MNRLDHGPDIVVLETRLSRFAVFRTAASTMARASSSARITWFGKYTTAVRAPRELNRVYDVAAPGGKG
jgi:hypothetical protein